MLNTIATMISNYWRRNPAHNADQARRADQSSLRNHRAKNALWMFMAVAALGAGTASAQSTLNLGSIQSGETKSFSVLVSEQVFDIFGTVTEKDPNDVLSATIDNKGNYNIPQSALQIDPFKPDRMVTVTPKLTGPITGYLNPSTGEWTMKMSVNFELSGAGIEAGCYIGPVNWNLSSMDSNGGVKYDTTTGAAVLVDDSFTIPAASSSVCGERAAEINEEKDLPTASGENFVSFSVAADPIVVGIPCSSTVTESESSDTHSLSCAPSTINGKLNSTSDRDTYSFGNVASGKKVYVEHSAKYTYTWKEDCVNAEDTVTSSYSGPLLKLNNSTAYTSSVVNTTGGKYCDMGGGGKTTKSVTTYTLKREVVPSNGIYTIIVDPNTVTSADFPVTGSYSLKISIQ